MALKHNVKDADTHFVVDADTRKIIKANNNKVHLMQYDHNSEEFTFEVPLEIENHDMSQCDLIQVHYENTSVGTSSSMRRTYRGVCNIEKDNITVNEENITFSWLISELATTFAGTLKFQLKFICYDNEDAGVEGYKWHTDVNEDIDIKAGLGYSAGDMTPAATATLQSIEIVETNEGVDIILNGIHHPVYHGSYADTVAGTIEIKANKTTSITNQSTNIQYPSAAAVYTFVTELLNSSVAEVLNTDVEV